MRSKPRRNANRIDPSTKTPPPLAIVLATLSGGSVTLTSDQILVLNLPSDLQEAGVPSDILLINGGSASLAAAPVTCVQINAYSVRLGGSGSLVAGSQLSIGPNMRGLRSLLGGQVVLGRVTF